MAVDIFDAKYAHNKDDGTKENVLEVFTRVATELGKDAPQEIIDAWIVDMMEGWYRPGGSIISGVGSKEVVSLANCTTIPLKGDSIKDIMKCMSDVMHCAARRQGLGVDGSVLRPAGSFINNAAVESTGAVPWLDFFNSMGNYVGQLGRRPAILLSLKVSHPDVLDFCKSKIDLDKIQNANISVQITDDFMETVINGGDWITSFVTPYETISETVDARELFEVISGMACDTAEPGVQFIDEMRRGSMIHQIFLASGDGRFEIISTNACSEKPLPPYGGCLLGSLNMGMFPTNPEEYRPILEAKASHLAWLIDCAITYEIENKRYGVDEQKIIMELTREIGLGITNLHQWFINAGVQYDSQEAVDMIDEFMSWYAFYVMEASQDIAVINGPAGAYSDVNFSHEDLMGSTFFRNMVETFYQGDPNKVRPLRNLALMSIAPTGTLSLIFPDACISSGSEPAMPAHWRKTRAISKSEYDYYFILPSYIKKELLATLSAGAPFDDGASVDYQFIKDVGEATPDNTGALGIEVMSIITKYLGESAYKPAHKIDPSMKLQMMSGMYKWIDAAVSTTYNVPEDTTADKIADIYMEAYTKGVRAVSVYREGSREGILVFDPPTADDKKKVYCEERPEELQFTCAPRRKSDMPCEIHHCKVMGQDWLVVVGMHKDYPYEIFAGEYDPEEMYVPRTVKEGVLRKTGAKYSLIVPIRRSEVEYKNIAETFMNERYRSLTRMVSLSLRHGVRPVFITDQLKKADEGITEFSSVVSRVLNKYNKQLDYEYLQKKTDGDTCDNCGGTDWRYEGGCKVCANCSNGKCG